jgi:hypothetical protein
MAEQIIFEGTTVQFFTSSEPYPNAPVGPFLSLAGTAVDPDIVTFGYVLPNQPAVNFTYTAPTGDPTGTIVRDGTGLYHADINTTGLVGQWIWRWAGRPNPLDNIDITKTAVATEGTITVLANDLLQ